MFIQLVQFETDRFEEGQRISEEWRERTRGKPTTVRRIAVCKDRDNADRYVVIVEFDSYEDAMSNSEMPETQEFSEKMSALNKGPTQFVNLDVLELTEPATA